MVFTVYALSHPINKTICYVGITSGPLSVRYKNHIQSSLRGGTTPKAEWIRNLSAQGLKPEIIILEKTEDRKREHYWISFYPNLLNINHGGNWRIKSHCIKGHPLSGENLIQTKSSGRRCRTCQREISLKSRKVSRKKLAEAGLSCRGKPKVRTTCKSGRHPWIKENLYISPRGIKSCKICWKEKYIERSIRTGRKKPERTHCKWGHLFTDETRIKPNRGRTRCKICMELSYAKSS